MNVEVVAMVYRSVTYTEFIAGQLDKFSPYPWRVLANDPTDEVARYLGEETCFSGNYTIHRNDDPEELYINRQYRGFNACVETSDADYVILVNSDHAFTPRTFPALVDKWDVNMIPVSRLVEREHQNHTHALTRNNFGTPLKGFKEDDWLMFAERNSNSSVLDGGMFMPVIFEKKRFMDAGMYPPGNVDRDGGMADEIDAGKIAKYGDVWFFDLLRSDFGMEHITVCDSLCYHIREGEKNNV